MPRADCRARRPALLALPVDRGLTARFRAAEPRHSNTSHMLIADPRLVPTLDELFQRILAQQFVECVPVAGCVDCSIGYERRADQKLELRQRRPLIACTASTYRPRGRAPAARRSPAPQCPAADRKRRRPHAYSGGARAHREAQSPAGRDHLRSASRSRRARGYRPSRPPTQSPAACHRPDGKCAPLHHLVVRARTPTAAVARAPQRAPPRWRGMEFRYRAYPVHQSGTPAPRAASSARARLPVSPLPARCRAASRPDQLAAPSPTASPIRCSTLSRMSSSRLSRR